MQQIGIYPVKDPTLSIRERIHITKQVGFEYLCSGSIAQLTEPGPDGFLACAEREGLPVDNVHLTGKSTTAIWFPAPLGDEVVERYQREMEIAIDHGVNMGVMHVTWGFSPAQYSEIGMERLRRLVDHAEKLGFTVCMENSAYPELFHAAMNAFDSPHARFTFDTGHWNAFFDHDDLIFDRYGDRIAITHLADNDARRDLHLIPLDGCADFGKLAHALKHVDRLTFELSGIYCKPHKATRESAENDIRRTHVYEQGLTRVDDTNIYVYEGFTYEQYLERVMTNAKRLRDMIEQA